MPCPPGPSCAGARATGRDAIAQLEPIVEQDADDYSALAPLGVAYALSGRKEEALRAGRRAVELYGYDRDQLFGVYVETLLSWIEAEVGEQDAAIDRLQRMLAVPNPYYSPERIRLDPAWRALRDHPRFAALTR